MHHCCNFTMNTHTHIHINNLFLLLWKWIYLNFMLNIKMFTRCSCTWNVRMQSDLLSKLPLCVLYSMIRQMYNMNGCLNGSRELILLKLYKLLSVQVLNTCSGIHHIYTHITHTCIHFYTYGRTCYTCGIVDGKSLVIFGGFPGV